MTMAVFISKTEALRPPSVFTTSTFRPSLRLTQQRQYVLRDLVGLCQYGSASLLQNLRAGHVGNFYRVVGIFDARAGGSQVGFVGVEVGDGILKTVLHRTQFGAQGIDLAQGCVEVIQRINNSACTWSHDTISSNCGFVVSRYVIAFSICGDILDV